MKKAGPSKDLCEVCKCVKMNTKRIMDYKRKYLVACPECAEEMAETLQCLKITTDWVMATMSDKYQRKSGTLVLTPLE
jgi:hypothetical protein